MTGIAWMRIFGLWVTNSHMAHCAITLCIVGSKLKKDNHTMLSITVS